MELDDFKKNPPKPSSDEEKIMHANRLIETFKSDINEQRRKSIFKMIILMAFSLIYLSQAFINSNSITRAGYALIIIGLLLGAIYLFIRYKKLPDSFYSSTTMEFINQAEKRLKYMNFIDWLIIIPLLLILGAGGGIIFVTRLLNYITSYSLLLVIWIVFFIALSVFAIYVSRKNWEKEHRDLLNNLQSFKRSIEGNE